MTIRINQLQSMTPNMELWQMLEAIVDGVGAGQKSKNEEKESTQEKKAKSRPATTPLTSDDLELLSQIVKNQCHRFGYQDEREDLFQDMVCEVLRLNLMGRYDPTKGASRKTFLSRFVYHRFCNLYQKDSHTRGLICSYDEQIIIEPKAEKVTNNHLPDHIILSKLEAIAQQLQLYYPPESAAIYRSQSRTFERVVSWHSSRCDGDWLLWRSHATIFRLLCLGLQQMQIASLLGLSRGNVCHRVDDIRAWPGVQILQQTLQEI
jgi:DNA-directed RNA polymerase specialized sigma24 family protein